MNRSASTSLRGLGIFRAVELREGLAILGEALKVADQHYPGSWN